MAGITGAGRRPDDVGRITAAIVVSALGTWSYNVGIAVYAYQETQSTAWVAAATVGRYVPALALTAFGTRWADRFPRRTVAVVCDVVCAVTMLLLTALTSVHGPLLAAIALAALSSGVARVQSSAALAVAADLVAESRLLRAMATISTSEAVATAAGPAIAAMVLSVAAPQWLFLLNGVTFAVSAALLLGVRHIPVRAYRGSSLQSADASDTAESDRSDDRVLRRAVRPLLATRTLAAVVYGMDVVLLAVIATDQLRQATAGYGWLLAAAGAGGLLAALWLRREAPPQGLVVNVTLGMAAYCVPLLVFVLTPALPGSLLTQLVRGAGCVLVTATSIAALQRAVPSRQAAPLLGLTHSLVLAGTCAGALLAPVLLAVVGLKATLVVGALVPLAIQLLVLPSLRRFERESAGLLARLDPRVSTLRGLALFADVSRWTLVDLAERAEEVALDGGVVLLREGDAADALYVLVTGQVEVTTGSGPATRVLRSMTAPSYLGEIGLLHDVARTATVTTLEPCVLWRIPAATFLSAAAQAGLSSGLSESVRVRLGTAPSDSAGSPVEL